MKNRLISMGIVCMLVISGFLGFVTFETENVSGGNTLYVGPGLIYDTIQSAVDAAIPGDTIIVANGTYVESVNISTPDISLIGNSSSDCKIIYHYEGTWSIKSAGINVTASGVNITGFNISVSGNFTYGINLKSSSAHNSTITSNYITTTGDSSYGIAVQSSNNCITGNTIITNNLYGFSIRLYAFTNNNMVTGNTIKTFGQWGYGIWMSVSFNNNVTDNKIDAFGQQASGIFLDESCNNNLTENKINTSGLNGHGIEIGSISNDNNLIGNTISTYNQSGHGIYLYDSVNNSLSGNLITTQNQSAIGIYLYYSSNDNNIKNNFINTSGEDSYGIYLFPYSNDNTIIGNIINTSGQDGYGFYLNDSSNNNILKSNTINTSGYAGSGIYLVTSSNNTLTENIIDTAEEYGHGISIKLSSNNNNLIANTINTSRLYGFGIRLSYSSNNTLTGNTINTSGQNGDGIYLSSSTKNILSDNTINTSGQYGYGIDLSDYSNNNNLTGNTINTSGEYGRGIGISSSSSNNLTSNTIFTTNSSGYGIRITSYSNYNNLTGNTIKAIGTDARGIYIFDNSNNNSIILNDIFNCHDYAVFITSSYYNNIYHNNIAYNRGSTDVYNPLNVQAYDDGDYNYWYYETKGNWWADWTTPDDNPPYGIVDVSYFINGPAGAEDCYPLVNPVDIRPPEITNVLVDGLPSVTVIEGTTVTLTATIDDSSTGGANITGANYTIGSQNWPGTDLDPSDGALDTPTESVNISISTAGWGDGSYDIYVYARDENYNFNLTSDAFATIIIDTTLPASSVDLISPYWNNTGQVTISATASDIGSSVESVELLYRYSPVNQSWSEWETAGTDTTSPWEWIFDFPESERYYELKSIATDSAGNVETDTGTDAICGYDTQIPYSEISRIIPYWQTTSPIIISAAVKELDSKMVSVELFYRYSNNNLTWSTDVTFGVDTQTPWEWIFDFPHAEAYYELYTIAIDKATNEETATTAKAICGYDVTPPRANAGFDQQVPPETTVTFDGSGTTDNFQHLKYTWTFTDGDLITLEGVNSTYRFIAPGDYLVTLNVTDEAGNKDSDTMWVNVSSAVTTGSISGTVKDEDGEPISGATVTLVGITYSATTDENGDFTISNIPAGTYDLKAEKTGYQDKTIIGLPVTAGQHNTLTTDSLIMIKIAEEEEDEGEEENYMWLILIIVIIIIIVVVMFLLKPWKKEPVIPEEVEPVTEEGPPTSPPENLEEDQIVSDEETQTIPEDFEGDQIISEEGPQTLPPEDQSEEL
ncbi:MAG: right-handed parallel beta-helix repeat-containing protein [Thermoplasmata archaeon]|nr:MAG: right-handed parallel beta-helix repeat-containing protein [Thermoplasmata archaeon]